MRLPLANVYRAFPELDRFSDEECEGFVMRAKRDARLRDRGLAIASRVTGAVAGVFVSVAFALCGSAVYAWLISVGWFASPGGQMAEAVGALTALVILVCPVVGSLVGRDWWLRRAIKALLGRASCPSCQYSLLGLRVDMPADPVVRCPECGKLIRLADYALEPEDLLASSDAQSPAPS